MSLFVNKLEFGDSTIFPGLTLGLLVLPVIIRTTEESLASGDNTFRQASFRIREVSGKRRKKSVFPIAFQMAVTDTVIHARGFLRSAPIAGSHVTMKLPTSTILTADNYQCSGSRMITRNRG
jgi:phosphate transport system permease protein